MDTFTADYLKYFYEKRDKELCFDFIVLEKKKIVLEKVKYQIIDYVIPKYKLNRLVDTPWVDNEVLNNLDNLDINYKITWFHKVQHVIYLKCRQTKFNTFQKRLNILLNMLNYIYDKGKAKESINIYLVLTGLKKHLNSEILGPKNINTGYTNFATNEIFVWREEEFEKVIFHEMIHLVGLDTSSIDYSKIKLIHAIHDHESFFEAFTDFWGIIYHTIYISFVLNKSVNSLFQLEYAFMENQANLINSFFKLGNWTGKKDIYQMSPAFSYFIVKYMLFKEIIDNKNINLINEPDKILQTVLSKKFIQKNFINLSPRMTLIQLL